MRPVDLFERFLDDDVVSLIVTETNRYADQKNRPVHISEEEIRCFLFILVLSGYVAVPRHRMYSEQSDDWRNEVVANAMRRDRFEESFANIYVADNTCLNKCDRFTKLRTLFTLLNARFILYASEQECYCIDESM